jgi:hypothetical protein
VNSKAPPCMQASSNSTQPLNSESQSLRSFSKSGALTNIDKIIHDSILALEPWHETLLLYQGKPNLITRDATASSFLPHTTLGWRSTTSSQVSPPSLNSFYDRVDSVSPDIPKFETTNNDFDFQTRPDQGGFIYFRLQATGLTGLDWKVKPSQSQVKPSQVESLLVSSRDPGVRYRLPAASIHQNF